MLLLSSRNPLLYDALLQEDRFVEWLTAALFIGAGVLRISVAVRHRRWFDLLVGAFCIFVGGEEFSWGQRLLGFTPPDVFLEHNTQQEFTLHNFADLFGKPKGILVVALLGYGLALPLVARFERLGATRISTAVSIWLIAAAALLIWYPVDLTGEWVEALAGFLFLASAQVGIRPRAAAGGSAVLLAGALTIISVRMAAGGTAAVACARAETRALLADIASGVGDYPDLLDRNVHKRIFTAMEDGYVGPRWPAYSAVRCVNESAQDAERRRRYLVDPWGMAYWVRARETGAGARVTVYSFGPNRNRDAGDIKAEALIE